MVLDRLDRAGLYASLSPRLQRGLAYLASTDWEQCLTGRLTFEGDELFALVSDYVTRDADCVPWEAHRRYIDIQYVHRGSEQIGHAPLETLQCGEYDGERDLLTAQGEGWFVTLQSGMFAILWPHEGHRPGICVREPLAVRKVVVKVAVEPDTI